MKRISISGLICIIFFTSFLPVADKNVVNDVLSYTNEFRKSKGLPALVMREDMNAIAQKHSEAMASGKVAFGHAGFDARGAQMQEIIKGSRLFAENVAFGSTSGKDVVNEWKRSQGHRRNMLGPYKYIGIGVARDDKGRFYYTQAFVD